MTSIMLLHAEDTATKGFVGAMPPLGLAWLGATLEADGFRVVILDRQVDPRRFVDLFAAERPALLGISTTTATRFEAFAYAAAARRIAPETPVVLGGSHATCAAEDTLLHLPQIDIVARGEGERTMLAIARRARDGATRWDGIEGISHRGNGGVIHEEPARRVKHLDDLGFPARHLLPNALYRLENEFIGGRAFHVMASRGCPHACTFCSAARIWGKRITFRSPTHVVDEMIDLRDRFGAEGFRFMDALVTLRRDWIHDLCEEIRRRGVVLPWECEVRADTIDAEILGWMKSAGCYYIDMGAESVNPEVLKRMRKKITPDQITTALELAHRLGIKTKIFFTFGHIGETRDQARETLRYIRRHRRLISRIGGGIGINIFPGTEVEDHCRDRGLLPADFSWSEPFHSERNLFFGVPPSVPIMIQPQLGWDDLTALRRRHLLQKSRDPSILLSNLKRLKDPIAYRRLIKMGKGLLTRSRGA